MLFMGSIKKKMFQFFGITITLEKMRKSQKISSSFLVPPKPVFMLSAHSRHALLENGKSFVHFLHTGLLHSEHSIEAVLVLQR